MIAIVDYEIGNIGSLRNAFNYLGESVEVVSDPQILERFPAIVLPGVGAFDTAMQALTDGGFIEPLKKYAESGRPILGICLGLQVLCQGSDEGSKKGLGLVKGDIRSLKSLGCKGKVPHVGFNEIRVQKGGTGFLESSFGKDFYFVHSFALHEIQEDCAMTLAYTEYEGARFISAFQKENIFATQFHPEKSGEVGLRLLSEFVTCSKNV